MEDRSIKGYAALIVAAIFAGVGYQWITSPPEPEPNLECSFQARPGQSPLRLGKLIAPVESVVLTGHIADPFEEMYDLEGNARFRIGNETRGAPVRGRVFLDSAHAVEGLFLTIEDTEFRRDGLRIATLNEQGILDFNTSEAFAYTERAFKMSHPMDFKCQTTLTADVKPGAERNQA